MSMASSRSIFRGATQLTSLIARRPISSLNKTPPAANKGPGSGSEQALPIGPYYEAILVTPQPIPAIKPEEPPTSSPKSPRSTVKKPAAARKNSVPRTTGTANMNTHLEASCSSPEVNTAATPALSLSSEPATAEEKARIIFGSSLAGPFERAERLKAIKDKSTLIAGILVPPRPEEPDNCCMSGCVNCVWDRYRDEMEEWVSATTTAEKRLQAERAQGDVNILGSVGAVKGMEGLSSTVGSKEKGADVNEAMSMDDDGGGSDTNWPVDQPKIAKNLWDENLYKGIPVGIREFMKTEKKLKERHDKEGTVGG